jgi:protein SCO1/2
MTRLYLGSAAALVIALIGGLMTMAFWPRSDDLFAQCRATNIAGGAGAIGGPFELVDSRTGETVTDVELIDRPSILYFGYTFCPDVCPLDNARNALAVDILQEQGHDVQPVFITIDPARDTAEVMAEYASIMHPDMIGLTGSAEQVRAASLAYRTYYAAQPAEDDFYLVDHSTFSYLVLPEHGFVELYRRDASADEMAESVSCFIREAGL